MYRNVLLYLNVNLLDHSVGVMLIRTLPTIDIEKNRMSFFIPKLYKQRLNFFRSLQGWMVQYEDNTTSGRTIIRGQNSRLFSSYILHFFFQFMICIQNVTYMPIWKFVIYLYYLALSKYHFRFIKFIQGIFWGQIQNKCALKCIWRRVSRIFSAVHANQWKL